MPQLRTKKQLEQKRKDDRRQELIKKVGKKMPSPKNLGKIALKATPPGMMLTAAQKLREELIRLTKPKKPGGRAPSTKRPKKPDPNAPKKPRDMPAPPRRPKVKDPRKPRRAPPRVVRDRRNRRKK